MADPTLATLAQVNEDLQVLNEQPFNDSTREALFGEIVADAGLNEREHKQLIADLRTSKGREAKLNPFVSEAAQGFSLGSSDEGIGHFFGPEAQAANRAQSSVFQGESPGASVAGQLLGGAALNLLPGAGLAGSSANALSRSSKAGALLSGAARGGGIGLLEGAIAGHNVGRGGPLSSDRLKQMAEGAKFGGLLGAGGGAFSNFLRRQIGGTSAENKAQDLVLDQMDQAGIDPGDINSGIDSIRSRTGGAEGVIADLDPSLQKFGKGLAAESPSVRRKAIPRLRDRDFGVHKRLERRLKVAFNRSGSEDFDDFLTARIQGAKDQTKDLYAQSLPTPVQLNATQRTILQDKEIRAAIKNKSAKFHSTRTVPDIYDANGRVKLNPKMTVDDIHAIQQTIGDLAKTESRAGATGGTPVLWRDRAAIMEAGFDATRQPDGSSLYKNATDIFAGEVQLAEAAEQGFNILKSRPGQIRKELANMSTGEREAYKVGVLESLVDVIDRRRDSTDTTIGLLDTERMRKRIKEAFGDEAEFNDLVDGVNQESTLRTTLNDLTGGSDTTMKLADVERMKVDIAGKPIDPAGMLDIGVAATKPSQSFFALRRVLQNLGEKFTGASRDKRIAVVLDKVGDILYSTERSRNAKTQATLLSRRKRNTQAQLLQNIRGISQAGSGTAGPEVSESLFP